MEEKKSINQTDRINTNNDFIPFELQKAGVFIAGTIITMGLGLVLVSISGIMLRQLGKVNL